MNHILKRNTIQKIGQYHQGHPWVWLYLLALLVLLAWGNLSVKFLPLVESNIGLPGDLTYESVAPGWASQGLPRSLLEPWLRWDTAWYLLIAKQGYGFSGVELAFPPLYPLLIRIIGKLLRGQLLLASLIVSWSTVFGACYLLEERFGFTADPKTAIRGIRNLLFFPTAIFFFAGYTESLFLFLVLLAWRYADQENWLLAGLLGAMATLTRFMGIVLVVTFGLMWLRNWRQRNKFSLAALLLIPLAYFAWGLIVGAIFQLQPSAALNQGWALHLDWPWVGIVGSFKMIFSQSVAETFFAYIDLLTAMVTVYCLYFWLRRKKYPEVLFLAGFLLISLMKVSDLGILGSTSRYVLPLFPIYLMLAEWGKQAKLDRLILIASIFLWLFCAAMFFSWNWLA